MASSAATARSRCATIARVSPFAPATLAASQSVETFIMSVAGKMGLFTAFASSLATMAASACCSRSAAATSFFAANARPRPKCHNARSTRKSFVFGGWLTVRSGWLADTLAIGATMYGSAPLYDPDDRDGTLLLEPGQKGYVVAGEAYLALRYKDYAILTSFRQLVDLGYVNPQDNRMTPNTFEGVTLGGKVGWVQYLAGYLWEIKPRNSDDFIAMSSKAGVKNQHDGVVIGGVRLKPIDGLRIDVNDAWGVDMFNTLFVDGDYLWKLNDDWKLLLGAQFTDQRAVNNARLFSVGR